MHHLTLKTATAGLRKDLRLPATSGLVRAATDCFYPLWQERVEESRLWGEDWMDPIGRICVGGCIFAAAVAAVLFDAKIVANQRHTWNEVTFGGDLFDIDISGYGDVSPEEACAAHAKFLSARYNVTKKIIDLGIHGYEIRSMNDKQSIYVGTLRPDELYVKSHGHMRSQDWLQSLESVTDRANKWADKIYTQILEKRLGKETIKV
jgi:hypothetical protein